MREDRVVASLPGPEWLDLWPADVTPVIDLVLWDLQGPVPAGVSLVVPPYLGRPEALSRLRDVPSLRVVQLLTAGYEHALPYVPDGVQLANAAGVHDASTAELALGLTIAALRGIGDAARNQLSGRWHPSARPSLADQRVLVLGAGGVGTAIAQRLAPFEVSVTRVGTRARTDAHGAVRSVAELPTLLPDHEVVILAVPLTEATRAMVDGEFLAAMPDGALLVNVARGPVVDTDALVTELTRGRLMAALDVTDPEPLPPDHPLWHAPNTLITPHVGGNTSAFAPRAKRMLREQFTRYAAGDSLMNLIIAE